MGFRLLPSLSTLSTPTTSFQPLTTQNTGCRIELSSRRLGCIELVYTTIDPLTLPSVVTGSAETLLFGLWRVKRWELRHQGPYELCGDEGRAGNLRFPRSSTKPPGRPQTPLEAILYLTP
ncbi:hypothetical protein PM082_017313 [Marasmius tenuissimus]|nr:hypothetical protein PM082_017313 [Marasmius tenuissimus]